MMPELSNSFALDAALLLASGYIALDGPFSGLFLRRYTGYILYFRIITAGIILLLLTYVLIVIGVTPPSYLPEELQSLSILSFLLACVWWLLLFILVPFETTKNENKKWLRFAPQLSGYRDKNSKVHFQIDYSKVWGDELKQQYDNNMIVAVEKIVSVQPFDLETYQVFNPSTQSP